MLRTTAVHTGRVCRIDLTRRPTPVVISGPNGTWTNEMDRAYQKKYRKSLPKNYQKNHKHSKKNYVPMFVVEEPFTITFK